MAQLFIAHGGQWKNISESFIADRGQWKHNSAVFVASNQQWKNSWAGAPEVDVLTWTPSGSAPWTRLVASYQVTGTWAELWITMEDPLGNFTNIGYHGPQFNEGTVAQSGIETGVLTPGTRYKLHVEYTSTSGVYGYLGGTYADTVSPPYQTAFWPKGPITHEAGGIEWTSFRDVTDWHSIRNNDGKAWHHGGDYPWIYEHGGLSASTQYWYQTQCMVGGVWGPLSPQQTFITAAAPYSAGQQGDYGPNGNSQTWQSSGADWQGNSRDWWYHANGSQWDSTRGNQLTCIYYDLGGPIYDNIMRAIQNGGQITRTRVYVHRAAVDAGLGGPVQSLVALNGAHFSNNPWNVSGNQGGPSLAKGQGAWVDVPAHWGRHIFEEPGTYTGWILGDSSNSNNYMALGKNNYGTGNMIIDIA